MSDDLQGGFSITQGGMKVAGRSGPYAVIKCEAARYAAMYRQDGPVKVRVWKNKVHKMQTQGEEK